MVIHQDVSRPVSPPMSNALDPVWIKFAEGLESRSRLTDRDLELQSIVRDIIAANTERERRSRIDRFFQFISFNGKFLYSIFYKRGITDLDTIADLSQQTIAFYLQKKLLTVDPYKGNTVTGSCRNYLGYAAKEIARDYFRRQQLDNQLLHRPLADSEDESGMHQIDGIACPTLSGLKGMLARDRQASISSTMTRFQAVISSGNSTLLDYYHEDFPAYSVREVLYRLHLKEPPDNIKILALESGINYQKLYAFYERHIIPRSQALFLEVGVLTGVLVEQAIDEINHDFDGVLQTAVSKKMPLITVQFMAQQRLWFYHEPPLSFEEIAEVGQERFGYRSLTAAELEKFWQAKCQHHLAKIAANILLG